MSGTRPLWVSVCLAVLVCASAASAGGFLVRSLLQKPAPLLLATKPVGSIAPHAPATAMATAQLIAASRPLVVKLESLSVERVPPKRVHRAPKIPSSASAESSSASAEPSSAPTEPGSAPAEPSNAPAEPDSALTEPSNAPTEASGSADPARASAPASPATEND
jgi:hypothetical protein